MKTIQKLFTFLICILTIATMSLPIFATNNSVTAIPSSETIQPGETFTVTVSIKEVYVSSLGISIECDKSLEIIDGKWLKSGLIASFDTIKNKAAFLAGTATLISGNIFVVTLKAKNEVSTNRTLSVSVIGKNGSSTVLEEKETVSLSITCGSHNYGSYNVTEKLHSRSCIDCGYTESTEHDWNNGTIQKTATCVDEGEIIYCCTVCRKTKTKTIQKTNHNHDNATCEKAAVCTDCGTVVEKARGHIDEDNDFRCDDCKRYLADVNGDGVINVSDLNDLLCYLSGNTENENYFADLDNNGAVNVADLNCLLTILASIE